MKQSLLEKLQQKKAVIGIVGLGYVGLPLALRYGDVGYEVVGFDIDQSKVDMLNLGKSYIQHIDDEKIAKMAKGKFTATTDFTKARDVDALIICVPTPLNKHREPDLSYVTQTTDALVPHISSGTVLSLESTTYPATTDEEILPRLQSSGLKVGSELFLVYSPEREDPGNPDFGTHNIPKVCGGHTAACLEIGIALYDQVVNKVVPVSSTRTAELVKLLENIHRAVNIGLVNEMKVIADKMDIDIHEVIRAASTKPFGFVPYYPGPGLGGHCIPIDPFYLTWKAREYGLHTRFIELAGEVNSSMPDYVISKLTSALNNHKKAVNGSKVLVLGLAYKKNVGDPRESASAVLMDKLTALGAEISYCDPYIPVFPKMREFSFDLQSIELTSDSLAKVDCVLIATDHDMFDYEMIKEHAQLIIDTRGRYSEPAAHIIKA